MGALFFLLLNVSSKRSLLSVFRTTVDYDSHYQNNTDQNNAHLGTLAIVDELGVRLWRKVREQQLPIYLISVLE